jgi:FkbM family methyltransferase
MTNMPDFNEWTKAWAPPTQVQWSIEDHKFFEYCKNFMTVRFRENCTSQNFQDAWVLYRTNEKARGYFVDFGATDGVEMSNTKILEDFFDWNGLLVEPNPVWKDALIKNRRADICTDSCVSNVDGEVVDFIMTKDPMFSTISTYAEGDYNSGQRSDGNETIYVPTITLESLLTRYNAPKHIDFLSIDTEGSEFDILNAFDFSKYQIDYISVEHNYSNKRADIKTLLESNGYHREFEIFSRWDDFYVKKG